MSVQEMAAAMKGDLKTKLDQLFAIFSQPALFLSEYFYEIRNSIDIETEQILVELKKESRQAADINQTRASFVSILKEFEQVLLGRVPKSINPTKVYLSLEKKSTNSSPAPKSRHSMRSKKPTRS